MAFSSSNRRSEQQQQQQQQHPKNRRDHPMNPRDENQEEAAAPAAAAPPTLVPHPFGNYYNPDRDGNRQNRNNGNNNDGIFGWSFLNGSNNNIGGSSGSGILPVCAPQQQQAATAPEVVSIVSSTSATTTTTTCGMDCLAGSGRGAAPVAVATWDCCFGDCCATMTAAAGGGQQQQQQHQHNRQQQEQQQRMLLSMIPEEVVLFFRGGAVPSTSQTAAGDRGGGIIIDPNNYGSINNYGSNSNSSSNNRLLFDSFPPPPTDLAGFMAVEPTPLPGDGTVAATATTAPSSSPMNVSRKRPWHPGSGTVNQEDRRPDGYSSIRWHDPSPLPPSPPLLFFQEPPSSSISPTIGIGSSRNLNHHDHHRRDLRTRNSSDHKGNDDDDDNGKTSAENGGGGGSSKKNENARSISRSASISNAVRRRFRLMTRGTRLVPRALPPLVIDGGNGDDDDDEEGRRRGEEVFLRTHALLGKGSFAAVTSVTVEAGTTSATSRRRAASDPERRRRRYYYACKSIKEELFEKALDPKSDPSAGGGDRDAESTTTKNKSESRKLQRACIQAESQLAYEAHILRSLRHPNIIRPMGFFWPSSSSGGGGDPSPAAAAGSVVPPVVVAVDRAVFLTEVLDETLAGKLSRWKAERAASSSPPPRSRTLEKLAICQQLAEALEHVHSRGVAYRDLKPGNVGFSGSKLKLFDFGLSREMMTFERGAPPRRADAAAAAGEDDDDLLLPLRGVIGTMRYMAPEVCLDEGGYDMDCDLYSYSVLCWEIWTHRTPYSNLTPSSYKEEVCLRGLRPPDCVVDDSAGRDGDSKKNGGDDDNDDEHRRQQRRQERRKRPRRRDDEPPRNDRGEETGGDGPRYEVPSGAVAALLERGWVREPSARIRWPEIRRELFRILQRGEA